MKIIRDIKKLTLNDPITATIGAFDGLHIGHQKIIRNIVDLSIKNNTKSALITFNPLPKVYFAKKNFQLLSMHKKVNILSAFNLDYLVILRFNDELLSTSSKEFVENILINKLNIKALSVGDDFRFGHNQEGSVDDLVNYSKKGYFSINLEKKHSIENIRVSSSLIRDSIVNNNFEKASKMLGRPYSISGKIMHGDKRGSSIGFPTANIKLEPNVLLAGVYAVSTLIGNKKYHAVANIGYKPTFNGEKYLFEAHIFNFSGNLYGKRLEFNIVSKIRETKKFSGIEELKRNINHDIKLTKKIFKI